MCLVILPDARAIMLLSELVTSMPTVMLLAKTLPRALQIKKVFDSCVQEAIMIHQKSKFLNLYIVNVIL